MSLVFDSASNSGSSGTSTLTWSHTVTGTNPILYVAIRVLSGSVSSVTFNGVAMVFQGQSPFSGLFFYQLVNPATGTHSITANLSSSVLCSSVAASYTGANQSGQPDNANTSSSGSMSITSVADNCWMVAAVQDNSVPTAGTGSTLRTSNGSFLAIALFDSNAPIHPAGSNTMAWGTSGGSSSFGVTVSPFVAIPSSGFFLFSKK